MDYVSAFIMGKYINTERSVLTQLSSILYLPYIRKYRSKYSTWKRSQVLEPSPQGVFRVVMRRVLVGIRTGPWNKTELFILETLLLNN